eukprot:Tbor_TRINITY_DN5499_c0_g1::TRINITY_DN5499_c0_g1_i1::g.25419::m.25419/K10576/UBE2H, UBC8; ubiquitin-conjugating enzyme E2 H
MASSSPNGNNKKQLSRRRELDFAKLASEERFVVHTIDSAHDFWVELKGPKDTPYYAGLWTLHISLPPEYPFKSPSIGFSNRIFHPNIDEVSGSVCLDVINQTWTPLYELSNVFDIFFPQLLAYPNPNDPLNPEAASLQLKDPIAYAARVHEHVSKYGSLEEAKRGLIRSGVVDLNPRSLLSKVTLKNENGNEKNENGNSHNGNGVSNNVNNECPTQREDDHYVEEPIDDDAYEPEDIDI